MFLRWFKRRFSQLRGDAGSGLILVISVMSVLIVLSMLVAGMTTQALGFTSSTRAGLQSLAAAEAGADYAAAQLSAGAVCQASYSNPATVGAPIFTVSMHYSLSASGSSWASCPFGGAAALRIKIVSTGFAAAKGVAGQTAGDSRRVENIYTYSPPVPIPATGSAVYSYNAGTFNNVNILSSGPGADVMLKTGDFSCTSPSGVQGSVLVAAGTASLNNGCAVTKNIWASGKLVLQNGTVGGNALSASTDESTFGPDTRVGGFVDLAGPGYTYAARCPSPNNTWDENGSRCSIQQSIATGTVTFRDATVAAPVVPDWLDYGYVASAWATAGFQTLPWPSSACNIDNTVRASTFYTGTFLPLTVPTVFDTRASCPGGLTFGSGAASWSMKTDIAFIVTSAKLQALTVDSSNAAQTRRLWFITPDANLTNHVPDCPAGSAASDINSTFALNAPVQALLYTACGVASSASSWRGQIYGKYVKLDTSNTITYLPVGLAGADLAAGVAVGITGGALGPKLSSRDLDG